MTSKLVKQSALTLSKDQVEVLPEYFAARDARNEASARFNRAEKSLGLSKFVSDEAEDQTKGFTVAILNPRGKKVAEISVSFRTGYIVDPTWINKVSAVSDFRPIEKSERITVK